MRGTRNPYIAREGIPFLLACLVLCWVALRYAHPAWLVVPVLLTAVVVLVFRDPNRSVPAAPLGVVSPTDGRVVEVSFAASGVFQGEAHRILIRIDSLGTYTARSPVEGKIMNMRAEHPGDASAYRTNALWVQTDEGDDVILQFLGYRFGIPPKSFAHYGERLGQGARCANLRLTRFAELHLPAATKVSVSPGQRVVAGSDLIGKLPHP